jgi:hypothetical protein
MTGIVITTTISQSISDASARGQNPA